MSNFYTDNESLKFYLGHPMMEKIVALKERNYAEKNVYPDAPADYEDALDNYDKVMEICKLYQYPADYIFFGKR